MTSDANQNMRLNPDEGTVLSSDPDLNPGDPNVVGSAYTESSFNATRPATTVLYAVDSGNDMLFQQNPANAGTLVNGLSLGVDIGDDAGFDIAGADNVAYLVATPAGRSGAVLYRVDLTTGKASSSAGSVAAISPSPASRPGRTAEDRPLPRQAGAQPPACLIRVANRPRRGCEPAVGRGRKGAT